MASLRQSRPIHVETRLKQGTEFSECQANEAQNSLAENRCVGDRLNGATWDVMHTKQAFCQVAYGF